MKKIIFPIIFIVVFSLLGFLFWQDLLQPVNPKDKKTKIFVIMPGESLESIADDLTKEGLVKNSLVFRIIVNQLGLASQIQAGDFRLSASMDARTIARTLTHGTLDVWVTLPEGKRAIEIINIINSKLPKPPVKSIESLLNSEGFLFPDTYLIPKEADGELIANLMINNFNNKLNSLVNLEKLKREEIKINGLTLKELITLASLIEREAKIELDRPKIASVIYNRLNLGMKLDIDSTVQYAVSDVRCLGQRPIVLWTKMSDVGSDIGCDWWPKTLSLEDLQIDFLYNTYLYSGLPPGPICNPGLASIKAALKPEKTDFLYYLSDKTGRTHYAKTLEEHNQNIQKYLND